MTDESVVSTMDSNPTVAGHDTQCVITIDVEGNERVKFRCTDCGILSNAVTAFQQHTCEANQ